MKNLSWLSEYGYQVLVDHLQDGMFAIEDEKFVYVNQHLADMYGYPVEHLIGRPFVDMLAEEDKAMVVERYRARLAGEKVPEHYDMHVVTGHGTTICCALNVGLTKNRDGRPVAIGTVRDVTQQRAMLNELQDSREELKSIFDNLPDIFYRTNMQGVVTKISPACYRILGYRQEEMLGTALSNYYNTPEERQKVVQAIVAGGGKTTQVEAALKHKNGAIIWIATSAFVRLDPDGQPTCIEGIARDISERKQMEDRLVSLSRIDVLTGIYNRGYFLDKCDEMFNLMRRYKRPASLMIADLDHFKSINDNHGHQSGDLALKLFAEACRAEIRDSDIFGRIGGEEFGLMLPETTIQSAQVLAERIRNAVAAIEIPLGKETAGITVSIGLVELNPEDASLNALLRRADLAMYQAKAEGRNRVVATAESC